MTYVAAEARQELLDDVAGAVDELTAALAALTVAYDLLDETTADRMEEALFGPVQAALGRLRRTHSGFAERFGLPAGSFPAATPPAPSHGIRGLLDDASAAVGRADLRLSELQDSMRPVEVGDPELRAGLADVRERLAAVSGPARELVRTLGR